MLVEGRQSGRAEGMSLHSLADFFEHMGAYNALEFDGGGSSSLAARVHGDNRLLSTPSGGVERYVPAGLGVQTVQEREHTLFKNIRASSEGTNAVISWETTAPVVSYASFGQASFDRFSAREPIARTRHTAILSDLVDPGFYYARLVGESSDGSIQTSQIIPIPPTDEVEVIVDDPEAEFVGDDWRTGSFPTPWGPDYKFTSTVAGFPTHTATYRPAIEVSGLYDVYTWYTQGSNRPADSRYHIQHAGGVKNVSIDQRTNGAQWWLLAADLRFEAGGDYFVRLVNQSNEEGKALIADAARWLLKTPDPDDSGTVPEWWMAHFFGDTHPESTTDGDGDGLTADEEYLWGTDPTVSESRPHYRFEREEEDSWNFTFSPFHEGRTYRIQGRASLTEGNWEDVDLPPPVRLETGEGSFALPIPQNLDRTFYRLQVEMGTGN